MRILVTGARGMLGTDLTQILLQEGHLVWACSHAELDITDGPSVRAHINQLLPDLVANCAAYTQVDQCEAEPDLAFRVNALGTRNLAVACQQAGAAFLHISTDYVFDGKAGRPYHEWDAANPINQYGRSKWAGEQIIRNTCPRHWIVRSQWLFGMNGSNFVRRIRDLADERQELTVVSDQRGSPTYTKDLASALAQLIMEPAYGTYHLTNSGYCSWYEFASLILSLLGRTDIRTEPQRTTELIRPAARPLFSVLENRLWRAEQRTPLRGYAAALEAFLQEVQAKEEIK